MESMQKKDYTVVEIALLAFAFNKSTQTISRWIKNNDDRLTSDTAKSALRSGESIIPCMCKTKRK